MLGLCSKLNLDQKKKCIYLFMMVYFIMAGIAYSIILPTIWLFLQEHFHSPKYMLGLVTTAYYVSSFVSAPILGRIYDKYPTRMKIVMLIVSTFEMVGSWMYYLSYSAWFLVCARLVAGVGAGYVSVGFALVGKTTVISKRTAQMSIFSACRLLGLFTGPAFYLLTEDLNWTSFGFNINKFTAPGILMATLWFVFIVLVQIIFFDFNEDEMDMLISNVVNENAENLKKFNENCKQLEPTCTPTEKSALTRCSTDKKKMKSTMPISTKATEETEEVETGEGETRKGLSTWRDRYKRSCNSGVLTIIVVSFVSFFNQLGFETLSTPLAEHALGWRAREFSLMFIAFIVDVLFMFVLLIKVSAFVCDRTLLICAQALELVICVACLIVIPIAPPDTTSNIYWFVPIIFFQLAGIPPLINCGKSLLSKLVPFEQQGSLMAVLRISENLGCVLGPLWVGLTLDQGYAMYGLMAALFLMSLLMILYNYHDLEEPARVPKQQ